MTKKMAMKMFSAISNKLMWIQSFKNIFIIKNIDIYYRKLYSIIPGKGCVWIPQYLYRYEVPFSVAEFPQFFKTALTLLKNTTLILPELWASQSFKSSINKAFKLHATWSVT